ncbi:MAG: hypothetical protein O7H39_03530 [Gammaproteobacteria bacterium]|nr:hypothetical protein [Gammaproteobacteria bacterium]
MSLREETETLRRSLERLAGEFETDLGRRYALQFPPPESLSLYRRLRVNVGRLLRWLGIRRVRPLEPWLAGLNHVKCSEGARPFVIWALDTNRDTLRAACRGFETLQAELPGWVPVLITDIADFAFFSRLGWLVEYVPELSEPAGGYAERKRRYLAWRYRDAPALPVSAGLTEDLTLGELLID